MRFDELVRREQRFLRIVSVQRDSWRCADCGWEPDLVRQYRELDLGEPPADRVLDELRERCKRKERHLHGEHEVPIE